MNKTPVSWNYLSRCIAEVAGAHKQVRTVAMGEERLLLERQHEYPLVMCSLAPTGGETGTGTETIAVSLVVLDRYAKTDRNNEAASPKYRTTPQEEAYSETRQIISGLLRMLKRYDFQRLFIVQNDEPQQVDLFGGGKDDACGWRVNVRFNFHHWQTWCDEPQHDFAPPPMQDCPTFDELFSAASCEAIIDKISVKSSKECIETGVIQGADNELLYNSLTQEQKDNYPFCSTFEELWGAMSFDERQAFIQSLTIQQVEDFLTFVQRNSPSRRPPIHTGQTISFATGDDADRHSNHGHSNILRLHVNHIFGHNWRFVGITGGYFDNDTSEWKDANNVITTEAEAIPDNYVIDMRTSIGWYRIPHALSNWATAISTANAFSHEVGGTIYEDWFLPDALEQISIANNGQNGANVLFYQPFNINLSLLGHSLWTSTSRNSTIGKSMQREFQLLDTLKTSTLRFLTARLHQF